MSDIIIVGAGGHAKVCIEILRSMNETIAFCIGSANDDDQCLGIPVLKGDENMQVLAQRGYSRIFIAIGANTLRDRLALKAQAVGFDLCNAISLGAVVSPSAVIKKGVAIMAGAVINAETTIDDLVIVNTGATVDHDCVIGRAAHIAPQSALAGNVTVGAGAFLGIGTKVIPGIQIGSSCVTGAGSVIVKDLGPNTKVMGVPAKPSTKGFAQ